MRFTVLASGSSGNACLLENQGQAVLIDAGLGPRQLRARLENARTSPRRIAAVILTHTHSDHCNERALAWMHQQGIRLFCHREHARMLMHLSEAFCRLDVCGLVSEYDLSKEFQVTPAIRCVSIPLQHDRFTCGFRFEGAPDLFGHAHALGYLCDLGSWDNDVLRHLHDLDMLALEFNHDVEMQKSSGRPRHLIRRVLSSAGHLSNEQAGELLGELLRRSEPGRLRHLVQLHLSRECNRPALALAAAQHVLGNAPGMQIYCPRPHRVGPRLSLDNSRAKRRLPRSNVLM